MITVLAILIAAAACAGEWEWQNPLPQGNTLRSIDFATANRGWAVGDQGTLLKTINAGTDWEIVRLNADYDFYSVEFIDEIHGWIAGGIDDD